MTKTKTKIKTLIGLINELLRQIELQNIKIKNYEFNNKKLVKHVE